MTKEFDGQFIPLTPEQMTEPSLPKAIQQELRAAANIERTIASYTEFKKRPGPEPKERPPGVVGTLVADSAAELDAQIKKVALVCGSRTRGNKRVGKSALYADLVSLFSRLKITGVTLPKDSISAKAIRAGLGEVLRRHGYTELSDDRLANNGTKRKELANKVKGILSQVAKVI